MFKIGDNVIFTYVKTAKISESFFMTTHLIYIIPSN